MKKLLLVDDSRAVRLAAKRILIPFNLELLEAEHGEAALHLLTQSGPVDAVLLDWNMPVMDGITFLRALRGRTDLPQPKVIMCTTENDMPRVIEALSSGANEYIMKPFTEEIIREKLQEVGVV